MSDTEIFAKNRAILCHFDSYSTALVFARFGSSLLAPEALPEGAAVTRAPADCDEIYDGNTLAQATVARYGLKPVELIRDSQYDAWLKTEAGAPIRIHLLRFKTFLAPADVIAPHGGVFLPISALRGAHRVELGLIRGVFNLIVGGDQGRA